MIKLQQNINICSRFILSGGVQRLIERPVTINDHKSFSGKILYKWSQFVVLKVHFGPFFYSAKISSEKDHHAIFYKS